MDGSDEILLVVEQFNVLHVAHEFGVGHFTEEDHGALRVAGGEVTCDRVDVRTIEVHAQFGEGDAVGAEDFPHGRDGSRCARGIVGRVPALPGSGPTAVEGVEAVSRGAGHEDASRAADGKDGLVRVNGMLAFVPENRDALEGGAGSSTFQ